MVELTSLNMVVEQASSFILVQIIQGLMNGFSVVIAKHFGVELPSLL